MKLDLIVEVVCQALGDVYYEYTGIKSITVHPPGQGSQKLTITDNEGDSFSIDIKEEHV
jgi:hypothetical protein